MITLQDYNEKIDNLKENKYHDKHKLYTLDKDCKLQPQELKSLRVNSQFTVSGMLESHQAIEAIVNKKLEMLGITFDSQCSWVDRVKKLVNREMMGDNFNTLIKLDEKGQYLKEIKWLEPDDKIFIANKKVTAVQGFELCFYTYDKLKQEVKVDTGKQMKYYSTF